MTGVHKSWGQMEVGSRASEAETQKKVKKGKGQEANMKSPTPKILVVLQILARPVGASLVGAVAEGCTRPAPKMRIRLRLRRIVLPAHLLSPRGQGDDRNGGITRHRRGAAAQVAGQTRRYAPPCIRL